MTVQNCVRINFLNSDLQLIQGPHFIQVLHFIRPLSFSPTPMTTLSKAWVCGRSLPELAGSNPVGGMDICLNGCVLSRIGICVGPITRSGESYGMCKIRCITLCTVQWVGRQR